MAQQTALDFFLMKLVDLEIGKTFYPNQHQDLQDAFRQAKQMEKEQIMKTARECHFEGVRKSAKTSEDYIAYGEQYYNETYGK